MTHYEVIVCTVTTYTADTSPTDPVLYTIDPSGTDTTSDNPLTIAAYTQTDQDGEACAFTETLTFSTSLPYNSWLTESNRVITADSSADSAASTDTAVITVTSTLSDGVTSDNSYVFTA